MDDVLGRYNKIADCPKCDHDDIKTIYHDGRRNCGMYLNWCQGPRREHLARVCERCRYSWAEQITSPTPEPCPECGGSGEVSWSSASPETPWPGPDPLCGTGQGETTCPD